MIGVACRFLYDYHIKGVSRSHTVGRSATAVKVLTREILSLTLDLLLKSILDL